MPTAIDLSKRATVERLPRDWRDELELVRKINSQYSVYREGTWCFLIDTTRNTVAVQCPLTRRRRMGTVCYHPEYTVTNMRYRGKGLAVQLYRELLRWGAVLVSGDQQSVGSQRLWGKLCADQQITVWAYNAAEGWDQCVQDEEGIPDCSWAVYERPTQLFAQWG